MNQTNESKHWRAKWYKPYQRVLQGFFSLKKKSSAAWNAYKSSYREKEPELITHKLKEKKKRALLPSSLNKVDYRVPEIKVILISTGYNVLDRVD